MASSRAESLTEPVVPGPRARDGGDPIGIVLWLGRSLVRHWDLLWQMVATDLRGRYVGSSLGLFWSVIHPLIMIVIYTLVFSRVIGARLPGNTDAYGYGLFLCSALLPWSGFLEVVQRSTTIFVDNANLVRKVAFPKVILYGYVAVSAAVNVALAIGVFLAVMLVIGHPLQPTLVIWLPFVALQLLFALGVGMVLSVLHVFLRDTAQLVAVALNVLFWLTPVIYVETILPEWLRRLEPFNPLYLFAKTHHELVMDGVLPGPLRTVGLLLLTFVTLAIGTAVYRRFRPDILDEL
jgi:lipopolysaccharide transport system permease protein